MIEIDGSFGEGGGQIVRTALALATVFQKACRVTQIRKGRQKPGLKAQHLSCIEALQKLGSLRVEGAALGAEELTIYPAPITARSAEIDIGTAGSTMLVLQSVLLPCLLAAKPVKLTITGGTDGKWAIPFDYFANILLPHLKRYSESISAKILKRGYYPVGGGKIEIRIKPSFTLATAANAPPLVRTSRGEILLIKGISHASAALEEAHVAERQEKAASHVLLSLGKPVHIQQIYQKTDCPGSGLVLWALCGTAELDDVNPVIIGADALGERGKNAEEVGRKAGMSMLHELKEGAPVDRHLADSLIPFLAVFGGEIAVAEITGHVRANIYACEQFIEKGFIIDEARRTISVSRSPPIPL